LWTLGFAALVSGQSFAPSQAATAPHGPSAAAITPDQVSTTEKPPLAAAAPASKPQPLTSKQLERRVQAHVDKLKEVSLIKASDVVIIYKNQTQEEIDKLSEGTEPINPLADPKSTRLVDKIKETDPSIADVLVVPREKKGNKAEARAAAKAAATEGAAPPPPEPWTMITRPYLIPWMDKWACVYAPSFAQMIGMLCLAPPMPPPPPPPEPLPPPVPPVAAVVEAGSGGR